MAEISSERQFGVNEHIIIDVIGIEERRVAKGSERPSDLVFSATEIPLTYANTLN